MGLAMQLTHLPAVGGHRAVNEVELVMRDMARLDAMGHKVPSFLRSACRQRDELMISRTVPLGSQRTLAARATARSATPSTPSHGRDIFRVRDSSQAGVAGA